MGILPGSTRSTAVNPVMPEDVNITRSSGNQQYAHQRTHKITTWRDGPGMAASNPRDFVTRSALITTAVLRDKANRDGRASAAINDLPGARSLAERGFAPVDGLRRPSASADDRP